MRFGKSRYDKQEKPPPRQATVFSVRWVSYRSHICTVAIGVYGILLWERDEMKVLVTGGSGTLGRAVCRELIGRGHQPVVYSRDRPRQYKYCPGSIYETGDIGDYGRLRHAMKNHSVDAVIHTAAIKNIEVCEQNPSLAVESILHGTTNVLQAMESLGGQVGRAILVSSDKACHRDQVYGMCKYLMEQMVKEYGSRLTTHINSIRFGNLFGSSGSVLPIWMDRIKQGKDLELRLFDGKPARRFVLLPSEAATCLVECLLNTRSLHRGSFLCPNEFRCVDMMTVAEAILDLTQSQVRVISTPANPGESPHESMFTSAESLKLIHHVFGTNVLECGDDKITTQGVEKTTRGHEVYSFNQTREFIRKACKEMGEWM